MNDARKPAIVLVVGQKRFGPAAARSLSEFDHVVVRTFDQGPAGNRALAADYADKDPLVSRDVPPADRSQRSGASATATVAPSADVIQDLERDLRQCLAEVKGVLACVQEGSALRSVLLNLCAAMKIPLIDAQPQVAGLILAPMPIGRRADVGCPLCLTLHRADRGETAVTSATEASHADLLVAAHLGLLALLELIENTDSPSTRESLAIILDFESHVVKRENVTPHPACRRCFPVRGLSDRAAVLSRTAGMLREIDADIAPMLNDVNELLPSLRKLAGDAQGLFGLPRRPMEAGRQQIWDFYRERGLNPRHDPMANAHSAVVMRTVALPNRVHRMAAEGFDFADPDRAECLAFIEALERLFALSLSVREDVVTTTYAALEGDAFDPRTYPLYGDGQYTLPDVPLIRFDPDQPVRWVTGVDLQAGRPLWIPHDLVYSDGSEPVLYRTNSTGAACHRSLRQAVINGLHELIERDAFQVAWLNRLSMPKISFTGQQDDPWELRASLSKLGFAFDCVQLTSDLRVPVILGVLRDRRNPDFFLTNMVGCLDVRQALGKLHREMAQFLYPYLISRSHFVNTCTTDSDSNRVLTFADHVGFYQTAERNALADFLTQSDESTAFRDLCARHAQAAGPDPLDTMLSRLTTGGMRVLVVDCSPPMLRDRGLRAVKVIVPGLQQLEDQHRLRNPVRSRLESNPERSAAEVNPWPHPFW